MIDDGVIFQWPQLQYRMDVQLFQLTEDFVTPEYTVPKGNFTDGATLPDILETYVNKFDRHLPGVIVHDWMYPLGIGTKEEADDIFERNLWRCHYAYGFPAEKIEPMMVAVRTFGKGNFYKKVSI